MMIFVYEIIESKMILTIQPEIPEKSCGERKQTAEKNSEITRPVVSEKRIANT